MNESDIDTRHPILRRLEDARARLETARTDLEEAKKAHTALKEEYKRSGKPTREKSLRTWERTYELPDDLSNTRTRQAQASKKVRELEEVVNNCEVLWECRTLPYDEWEQRVSSRNAYRYGYEHPSDRGARLLDAIRQELTHNIDSMRGIPQRLHDIRCYADDRDIVLDEATLEIVASTCESALRAMTTALEPLEGYEPFDDDDTPRAQWKAGKRSLVSTI